MVGTESDQEFLSQGATLMISWATGDNRSITAGRPRRADPAAGPGDPQGAASRCCCGCAGRWTGPTCGRRCGPARDYIAAWKHVRGIFARGARRQRVVGVVPDRGGLRPRRRAGLLPRRRPGRLDLRGRLRRAGLPADRRADGAVPAVGRAAPQADHHRRVRGGEGVGVGRAGRPGCATRSAPSRRTRRSRASRTSSRTPRATARSSSSSSPATSAAFKAFAGPDQRPVLQPGRLTRPIPLKPRLRPGS